MGLPQFRLYYWAANLRVFSLWRQSLSPDPTLIMRTSWLQIEREACEPTSLLALLNNPDKVKIPTNITSPVVLNSLQIWRQIQTFLKLPKVYLDSPIGKNHAFSPGLNDPTFSACKDTNIVTIGDLYIGGKLAFFHQLQQSHSLPASHFFKIPPNKKLC